MAAALSMCAHPAFVLRAARATAAEKRARKQAGVVLQQISLLALALKKAVMPPPLVEHEDRIKKENKLAEDVRRFMNQNVRTMVCACCSCFRSQVEIETHKWADVAEWLSVLRTDEEKTPEFPRDALTTYTADEDGRPCEPPDGTTYQLQAKGVLVGKADGAEDADGGGLDTAKPVKIQLCKTCIGPLWKGRVPKGSLARVDTGAIPDHLRPLSLLEEQLLAVGRAVRHVSIMRWSQTRSGAQYSYRGHLIAFPNIVIEDLQASLPMPLADIPKVMQVCWYGDMMTSRRCVTDVLPCRWSGWRNPIIGKPRRRCSRRRSCARSTARMLQLGLGG